MPTAYNHRVTYHGTAFSVEEVILSLKAQDQFLRTAAFAIAHASNGGSIEKIDIIVNDVSTGSLTFDMMLEVYGKYQTSFETTTAEWVESMFGLDIPAEYRPILTLAMLLLVYWIGRFVYEKLRGLGKREAASIHIEGDYNTLVQVISSRMNIDPNQLEDGVKKSMPPKKRIDMMKKLADFISPAKKRDEPIDYADGRRIENEALREFPSDAELREVLRTTQMIERPNATIDIRATDLDHRKQGWGGVVIKDGEIPETRIPMDIYPTVDPSMLKGEIKADIYVEATRFDDGTLVPHRIHVIAVRPA